MNTYISITPHIAYPNNSQEEFIRFVRLFDIYSENPFSFYANTFTHVTGSSFDQSLPPLPSKKFLLGLSCFLTNAAIELQDTSSKLEMENLQMKKTLKVALFTILALSLSLFLSIKKNYYLNKQKNKAEEN